MEFVGWRWSSTTSPRIRWRSPVAVFLEGERAWSWTVQISTRCSSSSALSTMCGSSPFPVLFSGPMALQNYHCGGWFMYTRERNFYCPSPWPTIAASPFFHFRLAIQCSFVGEVCDEDDDVTTILVDVLAAHHGLSSAPSSPRRCVFVFP